MEVWGGIESTVNRVGGSYFSQLERNGHHRRDADIERCGSLGISALRYPVLWERVAPEGLEHPDWRWTDRRLPALRDADIRVIAGLLHHGSGPAYTSLIDPGFYALFARYARLVAERYPWLDMYTPINEPLTTARFSCLYGLWYPHARDEPSFVRALLNQCRAVVQAMREIRQVNSDARLVQTDDLGRTSSTATLAYQAHFNNELRWVGWDLLCGRVDPAHSLWDWLTQRGGADAAELMWFSENSCPPDIIGVNYYVTSERFLDERTGRYPERYHGGNGVHRYADIEVARSLAEPRCGLAPLLAEAWQRYGLPLAVTEVHIDSTREDQLRWALEIWNAAAQAREAGIDVRAVTAWAVFGTFDWQCLLTDQCGYYEPGAFDVRAPRPRLTAVGKLWRQLANAQPPTHPVLAGPGWWRRADRFLCPPASAVQAGVELVPWAERSAQPIVISGATGTLGQAFGRSCEHRGLAYRLLSRAEMDIADPASVNAALGRFQPWAVINAAGYVHVDGAERDVEGCHRANARGPEVLASACAVMGIKLVTFSSDLVFDGKQRKPYMESDTPAPLNEYGKSKLAAEAAVLRLHCGSLVVRTSSFFGPWDEYNYLAAAIRTMGRGMPFTAADDITVTPTYVPDLVNACLDLLIDGESGIWHLTNGEPTTWAAFARLALGPAALDPALLQPRAHGHMNYAARRPVYSALQSARGTVMPTLQSAVDRYFQEWHQRNPAPCAYVEKSARGARRPSSFVSSSEYMAHPSRDTSAR